MKLGGNMASCRPVSVALRSLGEHRMLDIVGMAELVDIADAVHLAGVALEIENNFAAPFRSVETSSFQLALDWAV